jgi:exopolyphosphatase / guanosine-5'-triphosphate,3'-diphosphate pyrophosphatase
MSTAAPPTTVAAVDLGSNSFHMVVADSVGGQLRVIDRLRERVALAEGLDEDLNVTPDAVARALECLTRFGQRLRGLPPQAVRAVGTSTLRQARNAPKILASARRALGFPIEVVSGHEEARLIYLGVAHGQAEPHERRLVLDIGGGSTELILGQDYEILLADSLAMGCVNWSLRFFPGGGLERERMRAARLAAELELQGLLPRARRLDWSVTLGASGSLQAMSSILRTNGWTDGAITPEGLRQLRRALYAAGHVERLTLPGLTEDRAGVLAGGVAIASAVFRSLELERMLPASGALREGVLHDLVGRMRHEDLRDQTLKRFETSWHVDVEQAARVEATALVLLAQVAKPWGLEDAELTHALVWAARLHEMGRGMAYSGYHKHGAYIAANADMPGFSRQDQELLALLILSQRRKISREPFAALGEERSEVALRLALILRLAVLLNRGRGQYAAPLPKLQAKGERLELGFESRWLETHPLTRAELEAETRLLAALAIELVCA